MSSQSTYRNQWPLIIVLASLTMFDIMAIDLYLPAFLEVKRTFNTSSSLVQATLSVFTLGLALGQLVYGPLFDRYGRRGPLLIGIALFAVGSLLAALAQTIGVLLAARLVQAAGASAGVVAPRAIVTDLLPEREAAAVYSVLGQIQMVAPVAAPLLGALILQWSGWRASFWLLLIITLVIWVAAHHVVPDSLSANKRTMLSFRSVAVSYAALFRNRPFLLYSMAGALLFGALFAYISISPFILISKFGFSSIQFSLIFGGNAFLGIVIGVLNIRLLPSMGPRGLLLLGLGVQCLSGLALCLLSFTSTSTGLFVAVLACCIGATGMTFGNLAAVTMARADQQAGIASAFMGASQYAGGALVGLVTGWVGTTAIVLATVLLACALAALALSIVASRATTETS